MTTYVIMSLCRKIPHHLLQNMFCLISRPNVDGIWLNMALFEALLPYIFEYIRNSNMKLNEYGLFEFVKKPYSLDALLQGPFGFQRRHSGRLRLTFPNARHRGSDMTWI